MIGGYPVRIIKNDALPEGRITFPINIGMSNSVVLDPSNVQGNLRFTLPAGVPVPPFSRFLQTGSYLVGRFFAQSAGAAHLSQLRSIQVSGFCEPNLELFIWMPSIQRLITLPNGGLSSQVAPNKRTVYFNFVENMALAGNAEIDIIAFYTQLTAENDIAELSIMVNNFSVKPYFNTTIREETIP